MRTGLKERSRGIGREARKRRGLIEERKLVSVNDVLCALIACPPQREWQKKNNLTRKYVCEGMTTQTKICIIHRRMCRVFTGTIGWQPYLTDFLFCQIRGPMGLCGTDIQGQNSSTFITKKTYFTSTKLAFLVLRALQLKKAHTNKNI